MKSTTLILNVLMSIAAIVGIYMDIKNYSADARHACMVIFAILVCLESIVLSIRLQKYEEIW